MQTDDHAGTTTAIDLSSSTATTSPSSTVTGTLRTVHSRPRLPQGPRSRLSSNSTQTKSASSSFDLPVSVSAAAPSASSPPPLPPLPPLPADTGSTSSPSPQSPPPPPVDIPRAIHDEPETIIEYDEEDDDDPSPRYSVVIEERPNLDTLCGHPPPPHSPPHSPLPPIPTAPVPAAVDDPPTDPAPLASVQPEQEQVGSESEHGYEESEREESVEDPTVVPVPVPAPASQLEPRPPSVAAAAAAQTQAQAEAEAEEREVQSSTDTKTESSPSSAPSPIPNVRPPVFTPPASVSPSPAPSASSTSSRPPILTPIPPIELDPPPLPWKGMSLQNAQWTLTSAELQSIVSRAIRASARESFIRLQSLDILDNVLESECNKLEDERKEARARLRWLIGRRGMLLQALLSSTVAASASDSSGGGAAELVANLTHQLHTLATEADLIAQNLIQATARLGQIQSLIDVHQASALSIALRKLNASYAKRTAELLNTREQITDLKAQVDDAWAEAEKVAKEADDEETSRLVYERTQWEAERAEFQAERERFEAERRAWAIEREELAQNQVVNVHHPRSVNVHHPGTLTVTTQHPPPPSRPPPPPPPHQNRRRASTKSSNQSRIRRRNSESVSSPRGISDVFSSDDDSDLDEYDDDEYDEGTAIIRRAELMMIPKSPPPPTLGHMHSKSSLTFGVQTQTSFEFVPASSPTKGGTVTTGAGAGTIGGAGGGIEKIKLEIPTSVSVEPSIQSSTPTTPRSRSQSRASQVAAAKRRSRQPSLRLPKSVANATFRTTPPPPVPNIPQNVKANGEDDMDESSVDDTHENDDGDEEGDDEEMKQLARIANLGATKLGEPSKGLSPVEDPPRASSVNSHSHSQPRSAARPNSMDSHITGGIGVLAPQPGHGVKTVDDLHVFNKTNGAAGIPSMWNQVERKPSRNASSYFPPGTSASFSQYQQAQRGMHYSGTPFYNPFAPAHSQGGDTLSMVDLSDLVLMPVRNTQSPQPPMSPPLFHASSSTSGMKDKRPIEHHPMSSSPPGHHHGSSTSKMVAGGVMKLKGLTKRYSLPFPMFTGSGVKTLAKAGGGSKLRGEVVEEEGGTIGSSPLVRVQK